MYKSTTISQDFFHQLPMLETRLIAYSLYVLAIEYLTILSWTMKCALNSIPFVPHSTNSTTSSPSHKSVCQSWLAGLWAQPYQAPISLRGLLWWSAPFVPHWMLMALAKAVKKLGKCPFEMATFGGGVANVALDGLGLWSHSWFQGVLLRDLGVVDCEIWASRDFLAISLLGAAFHKRCGGGPTLGDFGSASKAVGEVLASPLALDASTSCAGKRMGAPLFACVINCRKTSYLPGKNQDCITVCCIGMQHMIE